MDTPRWIAMYVDWIRMRFSGGRELGMLAKWMGEHRLSSGWKLRCWDRDTYCLGMRLMVLMLEVSTSES